MKPSRPDLTLADVQAEFARTPFASPGGSMQPVGQRSLVRLPVFFAASWSAQGYRPGQVRSVSLLGRAVDFRIALDHFIYDFGDGHSSGATRSMGGAYPSGDIRHSYTRVGSFTPVLTAVLTADFRVDGGAWQPIGGTATRRGSFPPVTVHSASNRLVP
ncbi:hypothetical protein [Austwickia sp. TVS 96-490-7B]|uniref:hypothetical protein n=1 Tax=Austwickia sp. TVS 96-490-7B TaxID=2830843 RepID=UPI001C5A1E93|nr:hypothetical protein [Austwickia sp. TVS 96-490-7B]